MKRCIALFVSTCLLSACSPVYKTHYTYTPPQSEQGQYCLNQCLSQRAQCRQAVEQSNRSCRLQQDIFASAEYASYAHGQRRANLPIDKSISDFANYRSCNQNTESCDDDYNQCYTNCGGHITTQTVCVAHCDKK